MTQSYLSMLERGQRGYAQNTLEAIADALQCDAGQLLTVDPIANDQKLDPSDHEAIWSVWDKAQPFERELIVNVATAILKTRKGD